MFCAPIGSDFRVADTGSESKGEGDLGRVHGSHNRRRSRHSDERSKGEGPDQPLLRPDW